MEENELYDRIGETDLNPTYKDGQIYQHTDINNQVSIIKTAVNENYYDIQRLQKGEKTVGNAKKLDGATLSRYIDEELQADDDKIPSSQQVKAYMDGLFSGYSAPVRGVDYWTEADQQQIVSDTASNVIEEITPDLEEALAAKANINDIPTKISDLQNDSDFLSENNLQMVNIADVQNGSQITDATGYASLNKIYGDTLQNGIPTPDNPIDIEVVTGDIDITISNSDNSISKTFELSLGNIELCKIGNYKDYIYYDNGNWFLYKIIDKIVLDGSITPSISNTGNNNWYYVFSNLNKNALGEGDNYSTSTHYPGNTVYNNNTNQGICVTRTSKQIRIRYGTEDTPVNFANFLSLNNVILYYVLATPVTTKITDVTLIQQLDAIRNITLFSNETNFTITGSDFLPLLNITYAITDRDIYSKEEIDDKFEYAKRKIRDFYFDSVSEMQNDSSLDIGMIVETLGYYEKYDKGTYTFYINEKAGEITLNNGLKAKIIKDESEVEYIFPKNFNDVLSGDANIIKAFGKNILIDTHRAGAKTQLYNMLSDNNISHIDYLIITHYHDDHMGNVANLINDGYVDTNTIVYLPAYCDLITNNPTYLALYNEVINALTNANIEYTVPNENDYFTLGLSFKLSFYNCDEEFFNNSGWTYYNNMSTVCLVEHNNVKSLYTGDCSGEPLNRIVDNKFINSKVNLYKIEHHGINSSSSTKKLLEIIIPDFAVQLSTIKDAKKNNYSISNTINALKCFNTKIFSCHKNFDDYIVFKSYYNGMENVSGIQTESISNKASFYTVYVDSSTTNNIQDGTTTNPYVDLPLAVGEAKNKNFGDVEIHLADGDYGIRHEADTKNRSEFSNCNIKIIGNVEHPENVIIHEGIIAYNSNLSIEGCTIYCDNWHGITGINSIINVSNCVLTTYDTSNITNNAIYLDDNSFANISNCVLSYCVNGISAHNDFVNSKDNTFSNLERAYRLEKMCILKNMGDTLNNVTEYILNTGNATLLQSPKYKILTSSQDVSNGDITLNSPITNYNRIIVLSGYEYDNSLFNTEIFAYTNGPFRKGKTYNGLTKNGTVTITVDSSDATKISVLCSDTTNKVRAIYGILDQYE